MRSYATLQHPGATTAALPKEHGANAVLNHMISTLRQEIWVNLGAFLSFLWWQVNMLMLKLCCSHVSAKTEKRRKDASWPWCSILQVLLSRPGISTKKRNKAQENLKKNKKFPASTNMTVKKYWDTLSSAKHPITPINSNTNGLSCIFISFCYILLPSPPTGHGRWPALVDDSLVLL